MYIHRHRIDLPGAWTIASIGGKEGFQRELQASQLDAIDQILSRTRHLQPQAVTRADFDHPDLNPLLAEILHELQEGRGVSLISGVTPDRYTTEEFERIYFGFGTHWGNAILQTPSGGRLGHVTHDPDSRHGSKRNAELDPHTDVQDIVGLMCIQNAESGGLSRLTSLLTIHNEILRIRPDLLEPLYRGFPFALPYQLDARHVTPYRMPIFSVVDGQVSALYNANFIATAAKNMGVALPDDLVEAMTLFSSIATRADVMAEFLLEPGEILVFNNFTVIHARTKFDDTPERRRHLLRMWLQVPEGRMVAPEYRRFHDFVYYARLAYDLKRELDALSGSVRKRA